MAQNDEVSEEEAAYEAQMTQPMPYPMMYPQPQYGMPPTMNLELAEFLLKPAIFKYDKEDPRKVLEGYIPPEVQHHFWGFLSPDVKLSNMTENQAKAMMHKFKALKILFYASCGRRFKSIQTIKLLENMEATVYFAMTRGINGFERKEFNAQYQHQTVGMAQPVMEAQRPGIISRGMGKIFPGGGGF